MPFIRFEHPLRLVIKIPPQPGERQDASYSPVARGDVSLSLAWLHQVSVARLRLLRSRLQMLLPKALCLQARQG